MKIRQDIPTGPFDFIDMFGADRLVFTNKFVGPKVEATEELVGQAVDIYKENAPIPTEEAEISGELFIDQDEFPIGEEAQGDFEIDVELVFPVYSLERARTARGKLEAMTMTSTLVSVDVSSINVGDVTGRKRDLLSQNIWMKLLTRKIVDIEEPERAVLESKIRNGSRHDIRADLVETKDNILIRLDKSRYEMQTLIEFGGDAGDVIRRELDTKIGDVRIAAGNNFELPV